MMKKVLAFVLAMMMVMSLAACSKPAETQASTAAPTAALTEAPKKEASGTFKLGATGPLTGGAALYGIAVQRGAQIAVDEINAKDGKVKLDFRMEDDVHDTEKAKNAFNSLLDWGMQVSIGSVTSAPGTETAALAAQEKVFCLTPSASAPAVTEAGNGYVYQVCFNDPGQGAASAQYIYNKKLGKKVAVIYKNDEDYSTGIYETFNARAKELNMNVVSTTTFTKDSATDFSVQVAAAKAAGADIVFLPMYYEPASLILAEAKKIGYSPKFFGVDGMDGILTMPGFDTSLAEGVMLLTPFVADAKDAATQNFVKTYQDKYGETPIQFAADAYDAVYAIKAAIEAAGLASDMKTADITSAMISTFTSAGFKADGLTGAAMTWSADGSVNKDPKGMVIENGVYVSLD